MLFQQYKNIIQQYTIEELLHSERLQLAHSNKIRSYYTPFEHINSQAKVVLVGISPGKVQWKNALIATQAALAQGLPDHDVLSYAKQQGAFSGPMRHNLIKILDYIGLHEKLQLQSTAALFDQTQHLVHMTAVLPHAIFIDGKNYNGTSPNMRKNAFLWAQIEEYFVPQIQALPNSLYIPLGQSVIDVLMHPCNLGYLKEQQILQGFPHPSGANAERIQYFLGQKAKAELSRVTDPIKIDQAKTKLMHHMQDLQF